MALTIVIFVVGVIVGGALGSRSSNAARKRRARHRYYLEH